MRLKRPRKGLRPRIFHRRKQCFEESASRVQGCRLATDYANTSYRVRPRRRYNMPAEILSKDIPTRVFLISYHPLYVRRLNATTRGVYEQDYSHRYRADWAVKEVIK